MNKKITDEDINWPCDLSIKLKSFLMSIAVKRVGVNCLGGTPSSPLAEGLVYCLQGSAIISWSSYDMRNKVGAVIGTQDWMGFLNIGEKPTNYVYSTIEIKPVTCLVFPRIAILEYAQQDFEMYKLLFHIVKKIVPKWIQASITGLHDVELRVISALLDLVLLEPEIIDYQVEIHISQQQLSDFTGVSRPRVNEVLKHIERSGEIQIMRNKIQFNDIRALSKRLQYFNGSLRGPILDLT